MIGTTTRAHRSNADPRRGMRTQPRQHRETRRGEPIHYLDGANALDIGYLEPPEFEPERVIGWPAEQVDGGRSRRERRAVPQPDDADRSDRPKRATKTRADGDPAARTDRPPSPMALPRASFIVAMLSLVVVGVLGVLVINTKINENAFRLDDLQAEKAALDLREQQLAHQLAERESPGNLRAAAKRLGLVPAGSPAFINLPDGRVVGIPQPAGVALAEPGR